MIDFIQKGPQLNNQFTEDNLLKQFLQKNLSSEHYKKFENSFSDLGDWTVNRGHCLAMTAEKNLPEIVSHSPWGERIDWVQTSSAWKELIAKAQSEGIVGLGYDKSLGKEARLIQMTKLYLFHPSSAFASCPMAMTDGAARILQIIGQTPEQKTVFKHLTSIDPEEAWTSGQWMTEKTGGSDVRTTSTIATKNKNTYLLNGVKFFTSAVEAEVAMALAYIDKKDPKSLSLFLVKLKDKNGKYNGVEVTRLKDKLGTRVLPTAELLLKDCEAELIGEIGRGVATVTVMLNITRIYNSICSMGAARRCLVLMKAYAKERIVFEKKLEDQPLFQNTLQKLELEFEKLFHLTFYAATLLGRVEHGEKESESMLRTLTPLIKMATARFAIHAAVECVETFGGAGYVEDVGVARFLRDNQVFSIWEGTANMMSLDFLRALKKDKGLETLQAFMDGVAGKETLNSFNELAAQLQNAPEGDLKDLAFATADLLGQALVESF